MASKRATSALTSKSGQPLPAYESPEVHHPPRASVLIMSVPSGASLHQAQAFVAEMASEHALVGSIETTTIGMQGKASC